jgi:hypothetical protein
MYAGAPPCVLHHVAFIEEPARRAIGQDDAILLQEIDALSRARREPCEPRPAIMVMHARGVVLDRSAFLRSKSEQALHAEVVLDLVRSHVPEVRPDAGRGERRMQALLGDLGLFLRDPAIGDVRRGAGDRDRLAVAVTQDATDVAEPADLPVGSDDPELGIVFDAAAT